MTALALARSRLSLRDPVLWIRIATIIVLLVVWQLVAISGLLYDGLVPQPASVFVALIGQFGDPSMYWDLWTTVYTSVSGFALGSVLAIVMGLWLGSNEFMRRAFEPYIRCYRRHAQDHLPADHLPRLRSGRGIKIVKSGDVRILSGDLRNHRRLSANQAHPPEGRRQLPSPVPQKVRMIYVPAMMPSLLVGGRLGMAMAIIGVLAAEVAYSDTGLGYRLMQYSDHFQISAMYRHHLHHLCPGVDHQCRLRADPAPQAANISRRPRNDRRRVGGRMTSVGQRTTTRPGSSRRRRTGMGAPFEGSKPT